MEKIIKQYILKDINSILYVTAECNYIAPLGNTLITEEDIEKEKIVFTDEEHKNKLLEYLNKNYDIMRKIKFDKENEHDKAKIIVEIVLMYNNTNIKEMLEHIDSRKKEYLIIRQEIAYLINKYTKLTDEEIGKYINKDRTTVLNIRTSGIPSRLFCADYADKIENIEIIIENAISRNK